MTLQRSQISARTRRVAEHALYLEETLNMVEGWLRVSVGYAVAWVGVTTGNEQWRRRGTHTRLVGSVQRRLGVRVDAIERLVAGPALRHTDS